MSGKIMRVKRGTIEDYINPEKVVLLFLPERCYTYASDFLTKKELNTKFAVHYASIHVGFQGEAREERDTIDSLVLEMLSDEVLFEYKLSGRMESLVDELRTYVYSVLPDDKN